MVCLQTAELVVAVAMHHQPLLVESQQKLVLGLLVYRGNVTFIDEHERSLLKEGDFTLVQHTNN